MAQTPKQIPQQIWVPKNDKPGSAHFSFFNAPVSNAKERYWSNNYRIASKEEALKMLEEHKSIAEANAAAKARGERVSGITGIPYEQFLAEINKAPDEPTYYEWKAPWGETLKNVSQSQIAEIEANQQKLASGQYRDLNAGTGKPPLIVPKGTPKPGASYEEQLAGPAGKIPGVVPVAPAEIKTDGAPPISTPAVGNIVASGTGQTATGQSTLDEVAEAKKRAEEAQKEIEKLQKEKKEAEKSWLNWIKKGEETRAEQKSSVELEEEMFEKVLKQKGLTLEQFQRIGGLIGEISAYNQQIADLEARKQTKLDTAETLGMSAGYIAGEQNRITKQMNSEISAKGVMAGVKVQELQMLQGAYSDAKATASQLVELATYDQQQRLADIEWSMNAYKDVYNLLSQEEQTAWDRQYEMAKDELDAAKADKTTIVGYMTDPTLSGAGVLATDTVDEANAKVSAYVGTQAYINRLAEISATGRAPETPERIEDTFTDTVNALKRLRDSGNLTDFRYREEINSLMEVGGYAEEQRGEIESMVNRAMEGKQGVISAPEPTSPTTSQYIPSNYKDAGNGMVWTPDGRLIKKSEIQSDIKKNKPSIVTTSADKTTGSFWESIFGGLPEGITPISK